METVLQIFSLLVINSIVWYLGYKRGKTIKERELKDMEIPELTPEENEKAEEYYDMCELIDKMFTDDSFFDDETIPPITGMTYAENKFGGDNMTGDLSKSSHTLTYKVQPINPKRLKRAK